MIAHGEEKATVCFCSCLIRNIPQVVSLPWAALTFFIVLIFVCVLPIKTMQKPLSFPTFYFKNTKHVGEL